MRKLLVLILMAVLFTACVMPLRADSILTVGSATVGVGGNTAIIVGINGLNPGYALGVFDLSLSFSSQLIKVTGVTFGDSHLGDQLALGGFGSITSSSFGNGSATLFEVSLAPTSVLNASQASSFDLFTIDFAGLKAGSTPITLTIDALGDGNGDPITATILNGNVVVTPTSTVPEPTSMSLLLIGLFGIVLMLRLQGQRSRRLSSGCSS